MIKGPARLPVGVLPWLLVGALSWPLMSGCESEPAMPEGRIRIVDPGPMGEASARPTSPAVDWRNRQVAVRLDHPVEELWALSDETILSEINRAVWNGNGLRIGIVNAAQAGEIYEVLGKAIEVRDFEIRNFDQPELLRRSPPLRAEFFADLTVPPLPETKEYFRRGRLQLLMSSRPRGDGSALLTLLPQHHVPKSTFIGRDAQGDPTFIARTAAEKLLDGRIYDELGVELNVSSNEALLIGFYQPPRVEEEPEEKEAETNVSVIPVVPVTSGETAPPTTEAETEEPVSPETPVVIQTEIEAATPDTPEFELNLGRGLFTTGVRDRDLQILLLLRPLP